MIVEKNERRKRIVYAQLLKEHLTWGQAKQLQALVVGWPAMEGVNTRLAKFMTNSLPAPKEGMSLLCNTVINAINAWDEADTDSDLSRYGAYINSIIKDLPQVYRFNVFTPDIGTEFNDGGECWDPITSSLEAWMKQKGDMQDIVIREDPAPWITDSETMRRLLACHVLSSVEIRVLSEYIPDIFSENFCPRELTQEMDRYVAIK